MKRRMLFLALIATMMTLTVVAFAEPQTTLLVYMCGSDLQESACDDLYEMARSENGENVHILVLAGGAEEWSDRNLEGNTLKLVTIEEGGFSEVEDLGEGSMGDPEVLLSFLKRGMTTYPADRTIVVLWDHGAGTEGGICYDKNYNDDHLTVLKINRVLTRLKKDLPDAHIDIFGCDACMMATYEMASMLARFPVDYYVASEELEPGIGWYYTPWLSALEKEPAMDNEELCRLIIDSFMESGLEDEPEDHLTLSAVRLSAIPALTSQMEELAGSLANALQSGHLATIRRGRSRLYTFGSFEDSDWDMADMKALLETLQTLDSEGIQEAVNLLDNAVLFSRSENISDCSGMAILFPHDNCETIGRYLSDFKVPDLMPRWLSFINAYTGLVNASSYSFGTVTASQVTEGETISGETAGTVAEEYEIQDSEYGFCIQLTATDLENLDFVEGMLLMDISDEEFSGYVDLGLTRENWIDWESGLVYSLFDGSWPVLDGQPVAMYDQSATEYSRRSLIPVLLNGEATYLVVVFPAEGTEGRILGANAGYDESGLPIREMTQLKEGDRIEPVYTLYYQAANAEEDANLEDGEFTGDPIFWQEGMTVTYAFLGSEDEEEEDDEAITMFFGFVLHDLYGEEHLSELVGFEL